MSKFRGQRLPYMQERRTEKETTPQENVGERWWRILLWCGRIKQGILAAGQRVQQALIFTGVLFLVQ